MRKGTDGPALSSQNGEPTQFGVYGKSYPYQRTKGFSNDILGGQLAVFANIKEVK